MRVRNKDIVIIVGGIMDANKKGENMTDKMQEVKDKYFGQMLKDARPDFDKFMNNVVYLLSVAFNFGFEAGHDEGYKNREKDLLESIEEPVAGLQTDTVK